MTCQGQSRSSVAKWVEVEIENETEIRAFLVF